MASDLIFRGKDLIKEFVANKDGALIPADLKKELVLEYSTEEERIALQEYAQAQGLVLQADKIQRASIEKRTAGSYAINSEEERLKVVTFTSDIGARRLRTFRVLVNGLVIKPLLSGALTEGADIYKETSEIDRKGFALYNKSPYSIYIGEHTEVTELQDKGFCIPSGQGFSDALMLSNCNIIADATASGNYADVRVWITYLK